MKGQMQLPGLESHGEARVEKRQPKLIRLEQRILALELELYLLKIQLEKEGA